MSKNKGIIGIGLILAIVLGIVVVGGGAFYLGTKKNIENKEVVENPNVENQGDNNSISDWQTYKDIEAGYELKYPSDWHMETGVVRTDYPAPIIKKFKEFSISSEKVERRDGDGEGREIIPEGKTSLHVGYFTVSAFQYPKSMTGSLKDLINKGMDAPQDLKDAKIKNITNINIGGINKEVSVSSGFISLTFINGDILYIIDYNGTYYNKSNNPFGSDPETYNKYLPLFTKVLESFKFLDSEESSITKNDVTNQPAYIKAVYTKDGKNYIDVDYVQWIVCSANIGESGCENGYEIVNDNPLIRTFLVSDNVVIKMQTFSHQTSGLDKGNYNWNEIVSLQKFKGIIDGSIRPLEYQGSSTYTSYFKQLPYSITVKDNIVTEITERYIP